MKVDDSLPATLNQWRAAASTLAPAWAGIVLDAAGTAPGGSGVPNDWQAIRRLIDTGQFAGLRPLIAAGGLTPDTVSDVVRLIRPFAVDVSSGVEAELRRKDPQKVAAFIEGVRQADGG